MRINLNETLYIYLNYIIKELRLHRKANEMITNASTLLTPDQVMIGVPESLRKISFNVANAKFTKIKNHNKRTYFDFRLHSSSLKDTT